MNRESRISEATSKYVVADIILLVFVFDTAFRPYLKKTQSLINLCVLETVIPTVKIRFLHRASRQFVNCKI
jgi:hypothetical protein